MKVGDGGLRLEMEAQADWHLMFFGELLLGLVCVRVCVYHLIYMMQY